MEPKCFQMRWSYKGLWVREKEKQQKDIFFMWYFSKTSLQKNQKSYKTNKNCKWSPAFMNIIWNLNILCQIISQFVNIYNKLFFLQNNLSRKTKKILLTL